MKDNTGKKANPRLMVNPDTQNMSRLSTFLAYTASRPRLAPHALQLPIKWIRDWLRGSYMKPVENSMDKTILCLNDVCSHQITRIGMNKTKKSMATLAALCATSTRDVVLQRLPCSAATDVHSECCEHAIARSTMKNIV